MWTGSLVPEQRPARPSRLSCREFTVAIPPVTCLGTPASPPGFDRSDALLHPPLLSAAQSSYNCARFPAVAHLEPIPSEGYAPLGALLNGTTRSR